MWKIMNINRIIIFNPDFLFSFHVLRNYKFGIWQHNNSKMLFIWLWLHATTLLTIVSIWINCSLSNVSIWQTQVNKLKCNKHKDERIVILILTKNPAYCFIFKLPLTSLNYNCIFSMSTVSYYWNWQGALTFESSFHYVYFLLWYMN